MQTRLKEYGISLSGAQKWVAAAVGIDRPEEEREGELAIHREQDLIPISVMQILEEKLRRTQDDSKERSLLLSQKNKALQEKQDYEIYNATLKERNRIAREIHDNVGHVLSRSILMVGAAKIINKDPGMTAMLKNLEDSLNHAMNSIRNSVHDLHDEDSKFRRSGKEPGS